MSASRPRSENPNYFCGSRLAAVSTCMMIGTIVLLWDRWGTTPDWTSSVFALACALAVLHRVMSAFGWVIVLDTMNQPAKGESATRIWLLSDSRKWLPSRFWGYATRSSLAPKIGVSVSNASASRFLELILMTFALCLVALPGLWKAFPDLCTLPLSGKLSWSMWAPLTLLSLPVSYLGWRKMQSVGQFAYRRWETLTKRKYHFSGLSRAILFYSALACLNGLVLSCLIRCLPLGTVRTPIPLSILIAGSSLAWLWGLFASMSTQGWIHRECCLAFLLLPWLPLSAGISLAVLMRLVQLLAEVSCIAWVVATDSLHERRVLPTVEKSKSLPDLHSGFSGTK